MQGLVSRLYIVLLIIIFNRATSDAIMIDLRHENDTATLRTDGRKLNETRQVSFELGTMQNTSGSAIFTIGNTRVAAFVQGPHQVSVRALGSVLMLR